jgi:hypothetical protein
MRLGAGDVGVGAVLPAGEVEVLVAAEQVAERLGGEQRLEGVELTPLVDVHQAALEDRTPLGEVVLGQDQLGARAVELAGEAGDLPLDLVHDALGGLALPLEVAELVVHVVHLALEPLLLLLEPVALAADLLQPAAAGLELRVLGGGGGKQASGDRDGKEGGGAPPLHMPQVPPTLTRLPQPGTLKHDPQRLERRKISPANVPVLRRERR